MQDKTISLKFIGNLESALADHPAVFKQIKKLFHLPQDMLLEDRIPLVKFIHLLQVIQHNHGINDIGYRLGKHYTPTLMGTLGLYLQTCDTLYEAIHQYFEYAYLDAEFDMPLQLISNENTFSIKFVPPSDLLAIQGTYAVIRANRFIKAIQYFCASDITPLHISANLNDECIKFPRAIDVIQAPSKSITLTYLTQSLDRKLPGRNKTLNQMLKFEVEKSVNESCQLEDIVSKVLYHLKNSENLTRMGLGELANRLAMSERTLSRKLKDKGVQLKDMLIHAKKHFAVRSLSSGMEISEVANKLGLSDRSSFERAFKSWTNFTPAQFKSFNQTIPQLAQQNNMIHTDSLAAISNIQFNIENILLEPNDDSQTELASVLEQDPVLNAKIYGLSQLVHFGAYETSQTVVALNYLQNSHMSKGMCLAIINNSLVKQYNFPGINLDEHWQEVFVMSQFAQAVFATGKVAGEWSESEIHLLANTCHLGFIFLIINQQESMTKVFESYNLNDFKSLTFSQAVERQCQASAFMITALIMTHWSFPLKFVDIMKNMGDKDPSPEIKDVIHLLRCADEIGYFTIKNNQKMVEKSIEQLAKHIQIESSQLIEVYSKIKDRFQNLSKH